MLKASKMEQHSLFIRDGEHHLHLRHIYNVRGGAPVLMIHGAIENGKIFYTESGKGLGCYLAECGFDVYVADMRGRGKSTPAIATQHDHDQHDQITRDLPMMVDFIQRETCQNLHMIGHSWGGVLMASAMVRFPQMLEKLRTQVCFGTKRSVSAKNIERLFKIELVWKRFALFVAKQKGYLPAKDYKIGSDDETLGSLFQSIQWVKQSHWIDPKDGFDYGRAAQTTVWPPTWHFAASKDHALGHPQDIQRFIDETGNQDANYTLLGVNNGNKLDYDHINMLTHPNAREDHFPVLVEWLRRY